MTAITLDLPIQAWEVTKMKSYLMTVALEYLNKLKRQDNNIGYEEPIPEDIQAINESSHGENWVEAFSFLASLK